MRLFLVPFLLLVAIVLIVLFVQQPEPAGRAAPARTKNEKTAGGDVIADIDDLSDPGGDPEEEEPEDFEFEWAGTFVVSVVSASDGAPIRGALVRISRNRLDFHEESTDATGRVTLPDCVLNFSPGPYVLVRKRGYLARKVARRWTTGGDRIELVAGTPVSGLVLDARSGTPIAGARVFAWNPLDGDDLVMNPDQDGEGLFTDAKGRFELLAVPSKRSFVLGVLAPGLGTHLALHRAESPLVIKLGLGAVLSGVVTDAHDNPVSGVMVFAELRGQEPHFDWNSRWRLNARVRSDANGRYRIEGLPTPAAYYSTAELHDDARGIGVAVELRTSADEGRSDVQLVWPATVVVSAHLPSGTRSEDIRATLLGKDGRPLTGDLWRSGGSIVDGIYTMFSEPPGDHMLRVRVRGYLPAVVPIHLEPGERKRVRVTVKRGLTLVGRVAGMHGGLIRARQGGRSKRDARSFRAPIDEDGGFRIDGLNNGRVELTIRSREGVSRGVSTSVPRADPLLIEASRGSTVVGWIQPIPPAGEFGYRFAYFSFASLGDAGRGRTRVDDDGRFQIVDVPAGPSRAVAIRSEDRMVVLRGLTIPERGRVDIGIIHVDRTVLVAGSITPTVEGARVRLADGFPYYAESSKIDRHGRFALLKVPPDSRVTIEVEARRMRRFFDVDEFPAELALKSGVVVRGTLLDHAGQTCAGRAVSLNGRWPAITDSLGRFEFDVPAGDYSVSSGEQSLGSLVVPAEGLAPIQLRLEREGR